MSKEYFVNCVENFINNKNVTEEFVANHMNGDKYVFLFGGGHAAEYFVKYLSKNNVKIEAIIDQKKKGTIEGISIYSFEEIKKRYNIDKAVYVISAPSCKDEIKNELLQYVKQEQIYYFEVELYQYYGSNHDKYQEYILNNIDELGDIYINLADEYSKKTMLRVMEGRLTGNLDVISDIWVKNQYWPEDVINLNEKEVIIECGSSDGKTLKELCMRLNYKYEHIYCFEPDLQCKAVLSDVINSIDSNDGITYFEKGTYKETTELWFMNEDLSSGLSKIEETGNSKIDVVAIDDVIKEKVTYIKMDIEGAELDTLMGAKKIITQYRPKLAVCIYHKDSDILNIMEYLQTLNSQYKFYMRHHNCNMTETVLYAI